KEAQRRNVFLNLDRLLERDDSWFRRVEAVFEEARGVAEKAGIDLKLPALTPREKRRCEFVEGGGAFVSWDGGVHPCYFLWHGYQCHPLGWKQTVTPRLFGHVVEMGLLQIWNSAEYRTFRENVIRYDYPMCAGCRLAPCDYVEGEEFRQDCHIREEPCGACLWCMGVFQCLQ
ncbi:MAG TPA: SPASM domain-containing protein, partial [Verrucomicrobiae bacterium]|nr:SPASM domain-containing protein [Verrucomicrobiae bacterium]